MHLFNFKKAIKKTAMQLEFNGRCFKIKIFAKSGREKEAENGSGGKRKMIRTKEKMSSMSHKRNSCFRRWIRADIRLTVISLLFRIMMMNVSSLISGSNLKKILVLHSGRYGNRPVGIVPPYTPPRSYSQPQYIPNYSQEGQKAPRYKTENF